MSALKLELGGLAKRFAVSAAFLCLAQVTFGQINGWNQWNPLDGGNGHWYKAVAVSGGISWSNAFSAAAAQGAYLATATSAAENTFIFDHASQCWNGGWGPWLGGYQPAGSVEPKHGWCWVTGEPWNYDNWLASNPDDGLYSGIQENFVHFHSGGDRAWNDWDNGRPGPGYVMERNSAPHNVSSPSIPEGVIKGYVFDVLQYWGQGAVCSNGHSVQYRFDWNDGTFSTFGGTSAQHTWTVPGTYQIKAQACCAQDTSIMSDWSEPLEVTILPHVLIYPATNLIAEAGINWQYDAGKNRGDLGYYRKQYFHDQTVGVPLLVTNDCETTMDITLLVSPTDPGHPVITDSRSWTLTLPAGTSTQEFTWAVGPSIPFGFYDFRYLVTQQGGAITNADTTWLSGTNSVQICRGNPVILVHGYGDSASKCWGDMETLLEQSNNFAVLNFDYGPMTDGDDDQTPIECLAAALSGVQGPIRHPDGGIINDSYRWTNSIAWGKAYFSKDRVDVVAHSMGGLLARAYMAGMATNGSLSVTYNGDIDRVVTLGTPMCGGKDLWTELNASLPVLIAKPRLQGLEMDWGSCFLWRLNSAKRCESHLAIAGSSDLFGIVGSQKHDGIVSVGSAACPWLAGHARVISPYRHCGIVGLLSYYYLLMKDLVNMNGASAGSHQGYCLIRQFLNNESLTYGEEYAGSLRTRSYFMIDVRNVSGQPVPCWFRVLNPATQQFAETLPQSWHKQDRIHAYVKNLIGSYRLEVHPCGPSAGLYAPAYVDFSVSHDAPTLQPVTLQAGTDSDGDGLPDEWELKHFETKAFGPNDDPDRDGFKNYWELVVGTNPNDKSSHFEVSGVAMMSGTSTQTQGLFTALESGASVAVRVGFNATPGIVYELMRSVDLTLGGWVPVASAGPEASGASYLEDPAPPAEKAFYKVQMSVPE